MRWDPLYVLYKNPPFNKFPRRCIRAHLTLYQKHIMIEITMDNKELFKYGLKTKVMFKTTLLYLPAIFFTCYIDAFFTFLILDINNFHGLIDRFPFAW